MIDTDRYRVAPDGGFIVADAPTEPPGDLDIDDGKKGVKALKKALNRRVDDISELQRKLYADNRYAVLLVFQAMDAAGKDSTIRAVMSGVNPAGCQVFSFKSPSAEELDHDFLWRTARRLPERGRIGIFNRSYYEEVLAVRVRPEYLEAQRLPHHDDAIWQQRFTSINDHERHLVQNGTVILKFWLNVSHDEQRQRFLDRLTTPRKYWKFSRHDLGARSRWDDYMAAYQDMLRQTSTEQAPWYAIPADDKPFMRWCVADVVARSLESLPLQYPKKSAEEIALFQEHIASLDEEIR